MDGLERARGILGMEERRVARAEVCERLHDAELDGGSHEMLSALARAVMPCEGAWTADACERLRATLVWLLGAGMPEIQAMGDDADKYSNVGQSGPQICSQWLAGFDAGFASADDWLGQHEDAMAEHGWVRKDKEHIISHATVEITPHIDWSRMADELDEFVEIVRGMAGGAE